MRQLIVTEFISIDGIVRETVKRSDTLGRLLLELFDLTHFACLRQSRHDCGHLIVEIDETR
ncbi:hypothetical protein ACVDG8_003065 [Mesorhizobium sp. ORM8.1]